MDAIPAECVVRSLGAGNQLVAVLIQALLSSYCKISEPKMWPKDYGSIVTKKDLEDEKYDFIVVGAGAAGSVVANRLSENPHDKVLLLEAGGDPPIESEIPSLFPTLQKTKVDWQYYAESDTACLSNGLGSCYWPRGKMLGGSSGINYLAYVRGNQRDYDNWKHEGNDHWGYKNVLKYFKKAERNLNPEYVKYKHGKYHSADGPQSVKRFLGIPFSQIIRSAAKDFCIDPIFDINADKTLGFTYLQGIIDGVRRVSTAKSYLSPAKGRSNMHVIKHAFVTKVLFDANKRAIGVEFEYKGKNITVKAKKEVILSAGSIGSPQILMLSGVGPKAVLEKHGIELIGDLPVGKNLIDHLSVPMYFKFNPVEKSSILDDLYEYLIHESGPMTTIGASHQSAFVNTAHCCGYPDIQLLFQIFYRNSTDLPSYVQAQNFSEAIQKKFLDENVNHTIFGVLVIRLQPKSRGEIELISASAYDHPRIRPKYFSHPDDMKTFIRGMKQQLAFQKTEAYKKHGGKFMRLPLPQCDQFEFKSTEYLECYAHQFSSTLFHPCGTAKMGPKSDRGSVVDSSLRVRGISNLRVIDASIFPLPVSGNTVAASIMVGEKGADLVKKDYAT